MKPITLLQSGLDAAAEIRKELAAAPQLWNRFDSRRTGSSPHRELDDLWGRWWDQGDAREPRADEPVWYPDVALLLPTVYKLAYEMMWAFQGDRLGAVLGTRIPPGAQCHPHTDEGWHAEQFQKFALQIEAAPGQKFCFEDAQLETVPGDLFWFNNQKKHWVTNPTDQPRTTLIICIKTDWRP